MSRTAIEIGFVPLVDAATLIVAHEMGYAAEEGLALTLRREPSWSNIRDKVALGLYPAAHMLAPMPLAMTLGAAAIGAPVIAPFILSLGGNVIGASVAAAQEMGEIAYGDARAAGGALLRLAERRPVTVAAPYPNSMHVALLRYWLEGCGGDPDRDVAMQTVPPPLIAEALSSGAVDVFCFGEPWGGLAAERGLGRPLLPTCAIWGAAPEKVLGVRRDWAEADPDALAALLRALHRASRWAGRRQNHSVVAEMLATAPYLGVSAELIERALSGALSAPGGARFMEIAGPEATFPWRSQGLWIAQRCGARWGVPAAEARAAALETYRPDLYRTALAPLGADLPGASSKVEGALTTRIGVASTKGALFLGPDAFFDSRTFDPGDMAPEK